MSNDRLDDLEQRLTELEQERSPGDAIRAACTRREFIYGGVVGAAGMAAMTGTASAQSFPEDFQSMALLIGDASDKPDPNGSFFDHKTRFNYVYFAEDTAEMFTLQTGDESWTTFADIMQSPSESTDPELAFDTWRQPPESPTFVSMSVRLNPGAATEARVEVEVDEGGGTTVDYAFELSAAEGLAGNRSRSMSILLPDGGAYRVTNASDPDGANAITTHREQSLSR